MKKVICIANGNSWFQYEKNFFGRNSKKVPQDGPSYGEISVVESEDETSYSLNDYEGWWNKVYFIEITEEDERLILEARKKIYMGTLGIQLPDANVKTETKP
jgi:hypothetical protein